MPGAGGRQIRFGAAFMNGEGFMNGAGLTIGSGLMRSEGLLIGTGPIMDAIYGFVVGPLHGVRFNVHVGVRRVVRVKFFF